MEELDEFGIPIKKQPTKTVDEFGIPIKKKENSSSISNGPKLESVQTVGSSGGVKQNRALNALNTNNKIASSIPKSTSFRLPNDNDFKIMQLQGKVAPNSELKLKKVQNPDDLYNLKSDGTPVPKPKQKSITQTHWNDFNAKPFKVATIDSNNKTASTISKDVKFRLPDGYVQKPIADNPQQTEELYNFTEKHKATLRKEIDDKIEDNDLDLDYPYLYYSTFDKSPEINQNTQLLEEKPKDNFIERTFGEEKLKQLNINVADFDGFLNKKGYKNEFLDKEEKGLFNGVGTGKESYDISLAKEIQKKRLLSLYMGEINGRSLAKTKLEAEKRNLEKAGRNAEVIDDIEGTTPFDNDKFKEYIEAEMPNLAKKTKEVEVENKEIYAKHKSGEANLLYGTEKFFKKFGYGFLDKVNQITTTIYDKIGADERAQGLRFLNEERQISRPNTREVGYAKGLTTKSDGRDYLFTEDGRVIDQELKIDVTDLLEKYQYEGIKYSAKEEKKSDYTFSPQGSIMQFGGVAGDMIVQLALQKGVGGIASKATNLIPSLSKIPLSKGMSSSIISQSALGYTQGANETYKLAIDAGINEKEARLISNEAGQKIGLLYTITAPLSPQTKATQAIFGAEGKELIKKAILSYSKIGKKGFLETLQSGLSSLPRNAVNWIEEGLIKEFPQELIQQGAETYLINPTINNQAGQELKKETMSGEEVVNTLIQTVASGGLAVIPDLFSKTDKLKTLSDLSKDANFDSNLNNLVEKGVVTKEQANVLKKDVQVFSNQIGKIPKNLNKNIAMDVMTDLQEIQDLEAKKKTLDKSFHEDIDAEIETKRTLIKDRIKFDALSKKEITELKSTAKKELIQEAKDKDEDVSKIDNAQIVERANKIYSKQLKDAEAKTPTPEAQPQTEVPQQAEAEALKDVESTTKALNDLLVPDKKDSSLMVDSQQTKDLYKLVKNSTLQAIKKTFKDGINFTTIDLTSEAYHRAKADGNNPELVKAVEDVIGKPKESPKPQEVSPVEDVVAPKQPDNVIKVEPAQKVEIIDESLPKTDNSTDGKIPSLEEAEYKEFVNNNIVSNERLVDIADKVKKAEKLTPYENSIFHGKTSDINKIIADEKLSPTNTPTNGNVQSRTSDVGESGVTEPKSTSKESVQRAVDSGESKGDSEVKKPTTKEKIAERIKLSDANIEEARDVVKEKLDSIYSKLGIKPSAEHLEHLKDIKSNGVSFDGIIDIVADIAKAIANGAIITSEHIKQAIEAYNTEFDDKIDPKLVEERINLKKEADKESVNERITTKKETSKELEDFRDSWNREPSSDEYNKYDSGRTIEREHGELRNEQNYEIKKDLARVEIGLQAIEHAKKLFGAEYIEKTLEFLQEANLSPEKKAVGFVLLENEMDARVKAQPKSIGAKKLQDLVREKSQEFLANSARAIGAGRMRIERYRELAKNGFASEEFTNSLYSSQQLKDKAEIDKLVNISSEDLNKNDDSNITEEIKFEEPKVKRTKEAVKSDLKEALANMRKALNKSALDSMQVGIPYAKQIAVATPHIFKIAKLLAELGEMKTTEIVDFIHDELKEKFPSIGKKEITEILKSETAKTPKSKEEIQNNSIRETVKQALIDAGFYRNVKYKGEIAKRLDWKKIAGEENSVEKLRANVEKSLKEKGLSQKEISKMSKALEEEYNRLSVEIIEKGLKELESRNTPRKPVDMKSAAKKLAEYSNYGLFDKNRDSYEHLVNSVLGFNGLDQEAFVEMKQLAKAYVTLINSGHTEVAMKSALNEINRKQAKLLGKLSFKQSNVTFKVLKVLAEITNLSTRFKLVNLGNLAENISSGVVARTINNLTDTFVNKVKGTETTNKKLSSQSKRNARSKLKGIITDASESYGDTSSLLLNHSMLEDYLNEKSRNKLYHTIISAYMGRPVLEGADSYNKILITEAKMNRAVIKILEAKGMSNKEALSHVTEALTGESFEAALVKAKDLIEKINTENGSKLLVDTKEAINALASDIVKDALLKGDTMTPKELEASYKAAYKSAGRDIGHVSNNWISTQIGYVNSSIEKQITEAIKEKDWTKASIYTAYQIFWRNFMSTFVGGGTNWVVKQAQKSANPLSLISLVDDSLHRKGNLDITTDEGIKKMEEQLHREMNYRSTAGTIVFGTLAALTIFGAMKASGGDDDLNEWLKKNKWAKKFFDKMSPDVVVAMLAYKNKDMGRYFAKMLNVKADFFDDQKNILKVLKKYSDGKNNEASGQLGGIVGKRFEFPGPLRLINDMQQIYKKETPDYGGVPSGFWNGFFANGILEKNDLRPDPNSEITKGSNKGRSSRSSGRNR